MAHPLEDVMSAADGFVLIGDSSDAHFPAASYAAYVQNGKRFYCLDMGGLTEGRGRAAGGKVYPTVADLPEDRDDLAIIWVHPHRAAAAVDLAHEAGCTRVWFSFGSGHRDAVAHARDLGMEVVEIGRCPIYYVSGDLPTSCRLHIAATRVTGTYGRPPQTDGEARHRELI